MSDMPRAASVGSADAGRPARCPAAADAGVPRAAHRGRRCPGSESAVALPPPGPLEVPADAARSLQQTGQGMGEGVQTVARSARRAMNYFAREFAALEPSAGN